MCHLVEVPLTKEGTARIEKLPIDQRDAVLKNTEKPLQMNKKTQLWLILP